MAKKTRKKAGKKTAKKSGKKGVKRIAAKSAPKKNPAKRSGKRASGTKAGPYAVTTGSGPGPKEVGDSLVTMFNRGEFKAIEDKWWSPAIESIEGMGMAWAGRAKVEEKNAWWSAQNEIMGASAEGPFVGATGFAVKFRMEVLEKASGKRTQMEEVGVYTVRDGKIVREEFMYRTPESM
ncbi:MAG: nuclear transport factor 2 family protein [Phycisphaeraceae bacterium]|nr:nuclear transport factor 2 family protein [Phycisphaeraceae bacterium]